MMRALRVFVSVLILLGGPTACQQPVESEPKDSTAVVETAAKNLAKQVRLAKTLSGEWAMLLPDENYSEATFLSRNMQSNILLFEAENGDALELTAMAWNRNGRLVLNNACDIQLKAGKSYEIIYEKRVLPNTNDTSKVILCITPAGSIFHDLSRYETSPDNKKFSCSDNGFGKFVNDLAGDELVVARGPKTPIVVYNTSGSDKNSLPAQVQTRCINANLLSAYFIETKAENVLYFKENEWVVVSPEGEKKIFRAWK